MVSITILVFSSAEVSQALILPHIASTNGRKQRNCSSSSPRLLWLLRSPDCVPDAGA